MSDELSEARTMTEVGTKLDLARAYVDMGDPAGARSILEEVLDEGDDGGGDALYAGGYLPIVEEHRHAATKPVRVVYNSQNVEAALARDIAEAEEVMPLRVLRKVLAASTETAERELLDASDGLWVCSETDGAGFVEYYDYDGPISVVPNVVDVESYDTQFAARVDNPGVGMVFPATFSYPPNEVGARFLLDEVTPLLPDVPLTLASRSIGESATT